jgi:hypothetical protein
MRQPLFRVGAPGLALAAVLAVSAIFTPAAAATAGDPSPPAPDQSAVKPGQSAGAALSDETTALLKRQDALLPIARRVAEEAREPESDIAGVELDVEAGVVHVYRLDADKPLPGDAKTTGAKVVVHPAKFSRATMAAAADRVRRDGKLLAERQIGVLAVGPAVDGSGVTVSVLASTDGKGEELKHADAVLRERYGDVIGSVRGVDHVPSEKDLYFAGFRFNDFAPWFGGDRIASSTGACTTGFAATLNNSPVMLTAAHCGSVGTVFSNGPRANGSFNVMGSMVWDHEGSDVAAISVSSTTNFINVGAAESPTQLFIGSWATPVTGQLLCESGSFTGEVCNLRVVDTGQFNCLSWFIFCIQWQGPFADVINTAGSQAFAAGFGDSGGPVYLRTGGSGIAVGLVHGTLTANAAASFPAFQPPTLVCPSPEGASMRCSSGFSFAHMPGF